MALDGSMMMLDVVAEILASRTCVNEFWLFTITIVLERLKTMLVGEI